MIRSENVTNILIVSPQPQKMTEWLKDIINDFNVRLHRAYTCMDGYNLLERYHPIIIIVDGMVEDMNAMSFVSIVKDVSEYGNNCKLLLYNVERILQNTKADFYCLTSNEIELRETMQAQVRTFINNRLMQFNHSDEIQIARHRQLEQLPRAIDTDLFYVYNIFSPFGELSGDGLDYWLTESQVGFCGFLFDCTGHDLVSYTQGTTIRTLIKKDFTFYSPKDGLFKSLSDVFVDVNNDLFNLDNDPIVAAAIIFCLDLEKQELVCCSAGIPAFYVRHTGQTHLEPIMLQNYILGCEYGVGYEETRLKLDDIEEIMFTSDGFSELFLHKNQLPKPNIAKHDDVSAIRIMFKRHSRKLGIYQH